MGHADLLPQRTGMWADGSRTFLNDAALLDETQNVELENVTRPRHTVLQHWTLTSEDNPPPTLGAQAEFGHFVAEQRMVLQKFQGWLSGSSGAGHYYVVALHCPRGIVASVTVGNGNDGVVVNDTAPAYQVEPGDAVFVRITSVGTPIAAFAPAANSLWVTALWVENNKAASNG